MEPYPLDQGRKQRHGSSGIDDDRDQGKKLRLMVTSKLHYNWELWSLQSGISPIDMDLLSHLLALQNWRTMGHKTKNHNFAQANQDKIIKFLLH